MKNFKSVEWLKSNNDGENLVIFDVRYDRGDENYGNKEYKKGHIPNAIFIPLEETLSGEAKDHGGRNPLPDMEEFAQNLNNFGVDDGSTVVVYDDGELAHAGRLWWMLRYMGFKEVYVLLGGFGAWKSEGYPISTEIPKTNKGDKLTVNLQRNMIADINDAKIAASNDDQILIDARAADRYRGEVEPVDRVPGHIPGAINLPYTDLSKFYGDSIDDVDIPKIKEYFKAIKDYDKPVVHCGSGITATVNILFMEEVGISPVLYVGSYSDWVSYPDNEIATEI